MGPVGRPTVAVFTAFLVRFASTVLAAAAWAEGSGRRLFASLAGDSLPCSSSVGILSLLRVIALTVHRRC